MWISLWQDGWALGRATAFERGGMTTPRACAVTQNSVVGGSAFVGSIGDELAAPIIDLIKQWLQLRGIAGFLICRAMDNYLATVGVNRQVQFAPATPGLCPMLFFQPLARAIDLEPGTVHKHVKGANCHRLVVVASGRWLPGTGPPAQRGVIGHSQVQRHHF